MDLSGLRSVRDWTPGDYEKVVGVVERVVAHSFKVDGSRITGDEARRRAALCCQCIEEGIRGEGHVLERVLDTLGQRLRAKLDGAPVYGGERNMWVPERVDGRQ